MHFAAPIFCGEVPDDEGEQLYALLKNTSAKITKLEDMSGENLKTCEDMLGYFRDNESPCFPGDANVLTTESAI